MHSDRDPFNADISTYYNYLTILTETIIFYDYFSIFEKCRINKIPVVVKYLTFFILHLLKCLNF